MRVKIGKSKLYGKVTAPPSKSYAIRGLMCAALSNGKSRIINPLISDDTEIAAAALEKIGVRINKNDSFWEVNGGSFIAPKEGIYCRDSAATIRFMTALATVVPGKCRLVPSPALAKRPIEPLITALNSINIHCYKEGSTVVVEGGNFSGGNIEMRGDISSQFLSALLFLCPLAQNGLNIRLTTPPESVSYIKMTIDCLREFGINLDVSESFRFFSADYQKYKPASYTVEGDWSSASYLLAAGAIAGETETTGLKTDSLQGDRVIINLLQEMGAKISAKGDSITVKRADLKPIKADLSDCIDLLPTISVVAALADGQSMFYGIRRARLKESNRVSAVREGLERMQVAVTEEEDTFIINGGSPKGAVIDSFGDHRIAMAFGLLGAAIGDTVIEGAECVSKTFPQFWQIFAGIGAKAESYV
ncbi:MAG: 3-phosphoshikimate 1-carboxyvinyltransferase [Dehalococcoidales bacterium]